MDTRTFHSVGDIGCDTVLIDSADCSTTTVDDGLYDFGDICFKLTVLEAVSKSQIAYGRCIPDLLPRYWILNIESW